MSSTFHAIAARLLSENMPMHVPQHARITRDPAGRFHVLLDPGQGSSPDCDLTLRPAPDRALPETWRDTFPTYDDFLAYCVPQDRALSIDPWQGRVTRQEITLGIVPAACQPLQGQVNSRAAAVIAADATPACFHVASVNFRFLEQRASNPFASPL